MNKHTFSYYWWAVPVRCTVRRIRKQTLSRGQNVNHVFGCQQCGQETVSILMLTISTVLHGLVGSVMDIHVEGSGFKSRRRSAFKK